MGLSMHCMPELHLSHLGLESVHVRQHVMLATACPGHAERVPTNTMPAYAGSYYKLEQGKVLLYWSSMVPAP